MSTATDDKSATVASTLRAVAAAIDEGQPISSGAFLTTLADLLDGKADEEPGDNEGDVEQEARPTMPTWDELVRGQGGSPTIVLESEPLIQEMPIPAFDSKDVEHRQPRDLTAELANLFPGQGKEELRLEMAMGNLPIPDLAPSSQPIALERTDQGMPIPQTTLRPIHVGNQLLMEPLQPLRPVAFRPGTKVGEYLDLGAQRMPVPE